MDKELKTLKYLLEGYKLFKDTHSQFTPTREEVYEALEEIEYVLQRLESIDNANPTEALRCLKVISCLEIVTGQTKKYNISTTINNCFNCEISSIENALLKAEAQGKENVELKRVVEIIKDKRVNIEYLRLSTTVIEYNFKITIVIDGVKYNKSSSTKLTKKEFELLKKYI